MRLWSSFRLGFRFLVGTEKSEEWQLKVDAEAAASWSVHSQCIWSLYSQLFSGKVVTKHPRRTTCFNAKAYRQCPNWDQGCQKSGCANDTILLRLLHDHWLNRCGCMDMCKKWCMWLNHVSFSRSDLTSMIDLPLRPQLMSTSNKQNVG